MIYQGSKNKYASQIVPILQNLIDKNNIKIYIEPFVGGANIIDKIKCETKIGADKNYPLICLHQQAQKDFSKIPETGNEEWWTQAKNIYRQTYASPSMEEQMEGWKVGAIGFLGSFNNAGFSKGYARTKEGKRDKYTDAYKNFKKQAESEEYKNIKFICCDYKYFTNLDISKSLIYCDPPYDGTTTYGYAFESKFDHEEYWNWIREMSKKHIVICSEQTFPDDFEIIWEKEVVRTMDKSNNFKAVEKLGKYKLTN